MDNLAPAIIFDLDGTLIDIEDLYLQAARAVLEPFNKRYGIEEHRTFLNQDTRTSGTALLKDIDLSVDEFIIRRRSWLQANRDAIVDFPGVETLLATLTRHGSRLGLATNSPEEECQAKLKPRNWKSHFSSIVCSDHPGVTKVKPAPDMYLTAASELGAAPGECVVFEDSVFGITAAKNAGMKVIGVRNKYIEPDQLADADHIIDGFEDTRGILELCRVS